VINFTVFTKVLYVLVFVIIAKWGVFICLATRKPFGVQLVVFGKGHCLFNVRWLLWLYCYISFNKSKLTTILSISNKQSVYWISNLKDYQVLKKESANFLT